MKKYEEPIVEVVKVDVADIITTSNPNPCDWDGGDV